MSDDQLPKLPLSLIIGYFLSIVFTVAAIYFVLTEHFSTKTNIIIIFSLGVFQILAQVVFFLKINGRSIAAKYYVILLIIFLLAFLMDNYLWRSSFL